MGHGGHGGPLNDPFLNDLLIDPLIPLIRMVFVHGVEEIVGATAKAYGKTVQELLKRRRGRENEARRMAIYLGRILGGHKLEDIGKVTGLKNYSSVSSAYLAVKGRVELEKRLALNARKVEESLKSRKQTLFHRSRSSLKIDCP